MSRKMILSLAIALGLCGTTAQGSGLEFTPFGAYTVGGEFDGQGGVVDAELDEATSYGLMIDIPVSEELQVELFYSHQGTDLVGDGFGSPVLFEVDVDYLHVGLVQNWNYRTVEPYWVFSLGLTQFNPEGLSSETNPSAGLGGGVKVFLSPDAILGFKFGGRVLATYFDDTDAFCDAVTCFFEASSFVVQAQAEVGLVIRF